MYSIKEQVQDIYLNYCSLDIKQQSLFPAGHRRLSIGSKGFGLLVMQDKSIT
jgi:hypothetical protein